MIGFDRSFIIFHLRYGEPYNRTSTTSDARHVRFSRRSDSDSGSG